MRWIGLYRDVWIAAIASSRTRLATLTGAICKTSQCVTRKFGNVERNSHCDVLHITPIRVARLFLDCNGDFAITAYRQLGQIPEGHDAAEDSSRHLTWRRHIE